MTLLLTEPSVYFPAMGLSHQSRLLWMSTLLAFASSLVCQQLYPESRLGCVTIDCVVLLFANFCGEGGAQQADDGEQLTLYKVIASLHRRPLRLGW